MDIYYTYLIGWSNEQKYYYGVRLANILEPKDDLWNQYFTSSKVVEEFREEHGEPDVVQVRREFDDRNAAVDWETKVLKRLNVVYEEKWLNQCAFPVFDNRGENNSMYGKTPWNKGKTHSEETKAKISASSMGRIFSEESKAKLSAAKLNMTDETKAKISAAKKGSIPWNKGKKTKPLSEETKAKLSAASKDNKYALGRTHSEETKAKISATTKAYWAKKKEKL